MTFSSTITGPCISKLQYYANTEVRSWNPFNLFRKNKLKNHQIASELIGILQQKIISDSDILKVGGAIDDFEDSELQHDLLCLLYGHINDSQNLFLAKRKNIPQINAILEHLINKRYRPWWAFYLIELPYFSTDFRNNLRSIIDTINELFNRRRIKTTQHLINDYANDEIANQIISQYHNTGNPGSDKQDELSKILDISLKQSMNHTQEELIKEIKKFVIENVPFGKELISTAGLTAIISSYLSKEENKNKPVTEKAREIIYIINKVMLKSNAKQVIKTIMPGVGDIAEAVVSVVVSESSPNPLHVDRQIGTAVVSVAGGAVGGALGSLIPVVGTSIGAYTGAVLSKTVAARFYQALEAWRKSSKRA